MSKNGTKRNDLPMFKENQSNPGLDSLKQECNQLQQALLKLRGELAKTEELIQNLFHYLQERHDILLPINPYEKITG